MLFFILQMKRLMGSSQKFRKYRSVTHVWCSKTGEQWNFGERSVVKCKNAENSENSMRWRSKSNRVKGMTKPYLAVTNTLGGKYHSVLSVWWCWCYDLIERIWSQNGAVFADFWRHIRLDDTFCGFWLSSKFIHVRFGVGRKVFEILKTKI